MRPLCTVVKMRHYQSVQFAISMLSALIFACMLSIIRRIKAVYAVYNFFHPAALKHDMPLFKKYGIKKRYFSPLSSKDFRHLPSAPTAAGAKNAIAESKLFLSASEVTRSSMLNYHENGFIILKNYLSPAQADTVNKEIDRLQHTNAVKAGHRNEIMFAIHHSELLRNIAADPKLLDLPDRLLQGEAVLFQSINFTMGSEQRTHSDSIHMTTYPEGGLLGVWIALDDINENNGPLHYYPGSHRLPYYLNSDYNNEGNAWLLGKKSYAAYEAMIAARIAEKGLTKKVFTAAKGDILIWHANLFHGGELHSNKSLTRKSIVLHYFKKGAICYHEIT